VKKWNRGDRAVKNIFPQEGGHTREGVGTEVQGPQLSTLRGKDNEQNPREGHSAWRPIRRRFKGPMGTDTHGSKRLQG